MSLGTDIAAVLPELRVQAESLHTDTFTVYRATGEMVQDPVTLEERPEFATILSGVRGKFQQSAAQSREANVPGMTVTETSMAWHTSISTLGVLTNDEVECTAVGPLGDPDLVGTRMRIAGPFLKSLATARRFYVEVAS
jgi:hypothetical protein